MINKTGLASQPYDFKLNIFTALTSGKVMDKSDILQSRHTKLNLKSINSARTHTSKLQESNIQIDKSNNRNSIQMNKKSVQMKKLLDYHQEYYSNIQQIKFQTKETNCQIQKIKSQNQDLMHNYQKILGYLNMLSNQQKDDPQYKQIRLICQTVLYPSSRKVSEATLKSPKSPTKSINKKIVSIFQDGGRITQSIQTQNQSDSNDKSDEKEHIYSENQRLERQNQQLKQKLRLKQEATSSRMKSLKNLIHKFHDSQIGS